MQCNQHRIYSSLPQLSIVASADEDEKALFWQSFVEETSGLMERREMLVTVGVPFSDITDRIHYTKRFSLTQED